MNRHKKQSYVFFTIIFLIILSFSILFVQNKVSAVSNTMVIDGTLNLSNRPIAENGPIELEGEWKFYWETFLSPDEIDEHPPHTVPVAGDWNNYSLDGQAPDRYGYATYAMTIQLGENDADEVFSLYMPSIATAYDLWINGELITSQGQTAATREKMIPGSLPQVVTFQTDTTEIEILIHVSNFHQRKSGLWEPITFGTVEQIAAERERSMAMQAFVVGSIFIIGFYHMVLYIQRPKHKYALYLAVACFGVAVRTMLLRDNLFVHLFPQINWEAAVSLEYLAALFALMLFMLFVKEGLPMHIPAKLNQFFILTLAAYSLFVIVTPARIFTNTFHFFQVLVLTMIFTIVIASIIDVLKRQEGAYLNLLAMLVLSSAVMNDFFYYSQWISTDEFVSFGLLFYLFTQSVHLARRFSRSFDKVEQLSEELQLLNQSLELKVENRTKALQQANSKLQKIEESRRRLFANVSHELNTPLTFIQGYIKAMMDGVISKDDSTYLRTVYDDTKMMSHMIDDLQMLSKLESGQVEFIFQSVEARSFFSNLIEKQTAVFKKKGLHLAYEEAAELSGQIIVYMDPVRIEQAVMNFIINAEKYTVKESCVTLRLELGKEAMNKQLKVSITDTGTGINEKDLPYVFERFYKAKNNGSKKGGGLGLAIVKEIIESHDGTVGVHSLPDKETVFYFMLPILQINEKELLG